MPALKNPKHEKFAQAVANDCSAAEAYRAGWKCSTESAETAGPRLARDVQVMSRIQELKDQADKASKLTREGMVAWLERIILAKPSEASADSDICETVMTKMGPFTCLCSKMTAAEKLIKMAGWNEPEKHELEVFISLGGNAES
jgi:hypothetical protein